MAKKDCAHEDCNCIVEDNKGVAKGEEIYCSSYCAKAGSSESSDECQCGHEACV